MVAYSFMARFEPRIEDGSKDQTIRADRKRHARAGEELQLYRGMRTRQCRLIGRASCVAVLPIRIKLEDEEITIAGHVLHTPPMLDAFARRDGFEDWEDMRRFWRETHPDTPVFSGQCIRWNNFRGPGA